MSYLRKLDLRIQEELGVTERVSKQILSDLAIQLDKYSIILNWGTEIGIWRWLVVTRFNELMIWVQYNPNHLSIPISQKYGINRQVA